MAANDPDAGNSWRDAFVARQRNVIEHYREVLRRPVPQIEREAILRRISEIESEIQKLLAWWNDRTADHLVAA